MMHTQRQWHLRIAGNLLIFICMLGAPWWITLALIGGMILLGSFYEAALFGVLYDGLYGAPLYLLPIPAVMTLGALAFLLIDLFLKPRLLMYSKDNAR